MMTTYFAYYHEKLCFREISFKPRQGGVNSINIKKIIKIGWNALRDFRKLKNKCKHLQDQNNAEAPKTVHTSKFF